MIILNAILYYLIIIPISLLPFRLLYVLSDLTYMVLYKGFGYRTKVVRHNLKNSFPEKTQEELKEIEVRFYRHLCDVIVESLKSFTISNREVLKRMVVENPHLINKYYEEGRSVLIAGGHYNNWEWTATSLQQQINHQAIAIYTPLSNKFFDKKMLSTRGKFGLKMISYKEISKFYSDHQKMLTATLFAIDQSPRNPNRCYWTTFLNQDTGVQFGVEKIARKLDYAVIFGSINKIKRGYYSLHFSLISDRPGEEAHGAIIEKATAFLEAQILDKPQYWLWTHRRWKHKRPAVTEGC